MNQPKNGQKVGSNYIINLYIYIQKRPEMKYIFAPERAGIRNGNIVTNLI